VYSPLHRSVVLCHAGMCSRAHPPTDGSDAPARHIGLLLLHRFCWQNYHLRKTSAPLLAFLRNSAYQQNLKTRDWRTWCVLDFGTNSASAVISRMHPRIQTEELPSLFYSAISFIMRAALFLLELCEVTMKTLRTLMPSFSPQVLRWVNASVYHALSDLYVFACQFMDDACILGAVDTS
jgi:hypothetical protein